MIFLFSDFFFDFSDFSKKKLIFSDFPDFSDFSPDFSDFFFGAGDALPDARGLGQDLSTYYDMPIKHEGIGTTRRCLELDISLCPVNGLKRVLSYRTDADRQMKDRMCARGHQCTTQESSPCAEAWFSGWRPKSHIILG